MNPSNPSSTSGKPLGPWSRASQGLQARFQTLAPRERLMVLTAVVVVSMAILWMLLLAPALNTLKKVHSDRPALESQWQHMLGLQQQAQALKAKPRTSPEAARQALETSVRNSLGNAADLQWSGERATVTLNEVDAYRLSQWLARARTEANAMTVQTRLMRAPGNDVRWNGFIGLEIPQP